jgi:hypothetical protein
MEQHLSYAQTEAPFVPEGWKEQRKQIEGKLKYNCFVLDLGHQKTKLKKGKGLGIKAFVMR